MDPKLSLIEDMKDVVQYIFFFLIGTTVLNLAIALTARFKTKNKEFNNLILYWVSLFLTFFVVAALGKNPQEIAFAYFFQFIPSFLMAKMLMDSRGLKFNLKIYGTAQLIGTLISTFLLLYTDAGFTLSLLPVTITTTLPYWAPIRDTLVSPRFETNWIEKGMGVMFVTGVLNHFNYAFFRLDESTAWWGWSVSIAQYQCISIFLPLLINHRRETNERKNLEASLKKMSGQQINYNVEIDELYRSLELQIGQKEELTKKLQKSNLNLEEEREMNEMLIKTVSHDLANPLTVINAYIDMIHSGRIPEEDRKMIWDRIKMNTKSALDMIARIRDAIVTRNQASIVAIHDVSIDRSIRRLMNHFDSRLKEKNINLVYNSKVPLDVFVAAEENTLTEHVFANILSNALKFSYEGSEIEIRVLDVDNTIQVEFRDHGTGIDSNRLEKRLLHTTEGTRGEAGSGFGMMVMGYFLRKFGASYLIKSDGLDKGTTVTVNLKKSIVKTYRPVLDKKPANIFS